MLARQASRRQHDHIGRGNAQALGRGISRRDRRYDQQRLDGDRQRARFDRPVAHRGEYDPAARFGAEPKVIPGSLRRIALPPGLALARVRATVEKHCGPGKPGLPPGLTEADLERERPTVTLDQLIAELNGELKEKRKSRFGGHDPVEDENLPPLVYYDAEQTLPKVPGGCTVLVIGPKSSHKTGLILKNLSTRSSTTAPRCCSLRPKARTASARPGCRRPAALAGCQTKRSARTGARNRRTSIC